MKYMLTFALNFILIFNAFSQFNESIFDELDPSNFNIDFSKYDQKTAIFSAHLSNLVYESKDSIATFISQLDLIYPNAGIKHVFVKNKETDSEVLLFFTDEYLIISFRGTAGAKDLWTDAKLLLYKNKKTNKNKYKDIPAGHGGFRKALNSLIDESQLFEKIASLISKKTKQTFPVFLTGHSLGAALSELFILPLKKRGYKYSGGYNFAPPLAISNSTSDSLKLNPSIQNVTYDIVNYTDYITRLGRYCRKNMSHFGKYYRICYDVNNNEYTNPKIQQENEIPFKYKFWEKFKLSSLFDKFHKMNHYLIAVQAPLNSSEHVENQNVSDIVDCSCLKPTNCIKN
jgi:hypothetical protein